MIRIKNELIDESLIGAVSLNDDNKEIIINIRGIGILIFAKEFKHGIIPRERVITTDEYLKIKDYFMIDKKSVVVV